MSLRRYKRLSEDARSLRGCNCLSDDVSLRGYMCLLEDSSVSQ